MTRRRIALLLPFLLVAVSVGKSRMVGAQDAVGQKDAAILQEKANRAVWKWSDHENSLLYCVSNCLRGYEVRVIRPKEAKWHKPFKIEILLAMISHHLSHPAQ